MCVTFVKFFIFLILIFDFRRQGVEGARILGVFPLAGKSLNILYNRLMRGLADVGHDVTVISAYRNSKPIVNGSFTDVLLTGFADDYENMFDTPDWLDSPEQFSVWESMNIHDLVFPIFSQALHHPNVLEFLRKDHSFDLVITEYAWSESFLAFASIYKCPLVIFASMGGTNTWANEMAGNPMPVSYVPHYWMLGDYSHGMTFFKRLHNLLYYLYDPIHNHFTAFPAHNELLKSVFRNPPDVAALYYNASLVLLGSHSSIHQAVPLTPNIVEMGGFHIEPPKKLPKDLQDFLDSATDGAIYFSMGSHIKSKHFSDDRKRMFLNIFRRLKMKVLWKFEDEILPGKPDNVLIRKWLPQMDILAHPNIRLFISHGGFGSTLETIYHGVPILMIPVFVDQFNNANQAQAKGYALKLSYGDKNFTEDTLAALIHEMLNNPTYTQKAKLISSLFHDRPLKPLETAIYWIEYVMRYKGADHLKVAGLNLPWYKYYMVDVLLFLVAALVIIVYVSCRLFRAIFLRGETFGKAKQH